MRYLKISTVVISSLLLSSGLPTLAVAQSTGLNDMVGARAGQAEGELRRRGYVNTGGQKGDDRSYTNWWNADRRQCVTIATMNGRYDSITPTTPPDCGKSTSSRPGRERRHSESRRADPAPVPANELSRICREEAAAAFDRRPSEITANLPIRQRDGVLVQGWYEGRRGTQFFNCRFDADGRFRSVS